MVIPGAKSLKQKRSAIRKVIQRTQSKFQLSIAEVDQQDVWQRGTLGFAVVGNEHGLIQRRVSKIVEHIEQLFVVSILDVNSTVMSYKPTLDERSGFRFE